MATIGQASDRNADGPAIVLTAPYAIGFSSWADWLLASSQQWWTYETSTWHNITPYDGIWIDLSEASSFCVGSCGISHTHGNL